MQMPERVFSSGSYRYGFNGKENDNDVKGTGKQQDYGMRIYDPRLGRFLSTDPLTKYYPMLTPYQYASNSPIWMIDLDGLEGVKFSDVWNGKANFIQFLEDPDVSGTVGDFNRSFNPVYQLNDYGVKLRTGKDYDGRPIDNRGKAGVVADLGVETMMWLTFVKLGNIKANNPVETQLNQQAKALGNTQPSAKQAAAENATKQTTKSTVSKPTSLVTPEIQQIPINKVYGSITRYIRFSNNWASASLNSKLNELAPGSTGVFNAATGKTTYTNSNSGLQIVLDVVSDYFTIKDKTGKYLGIDGKPVNVGKLTGKAADDFEKANTHFINSDSK